MTFKPFLGFEFLFKCDDLQVYCTVAQVVKHDEKHERVIAVQNDIAPGEELESVVITHVLGAKSCIIHVYLRMGQRDIFMRDAASVELQLSRESVKAVENPVMKGTLDNILRIFPEG